VPVSASGVKIVGMAETVAPITLDGYFNPSKSYYITFSGSSPSSARLTLRPGHTAFRVLTASESRPKNGTREADAVKREEDAMKT